MKNNQRKYKKNSPSDELYTPEVAVEMILPFIPKHVSRIWECTAIPESSIVKILRENGYSVISTHISEGYDFLKWSPTDYDLIISNPPYSLKDEFLTRAFELGKPFMFLLPDTTLGGIERGRLFGTHKIQLIVPDRRFNFMPWKKKGSWFHTTWFTFGLGLEKDLNHIPIGKDGETDCKIKSDIPVTNPKGDSLPPKTKRKKALEKGKQMKSWLKTSSFNVKDEYYTPAMMVYPIVKYLNPGTTIWCPFDTENSEFVKVLTNEGFKVIHSHIWEGRDFFDYEPSEPYDYIISNPPFTRKLDILRRLYQLRKPFAMIFGLPILNYQEIGEFFLDKNLELLIFDKKVSFDGNTASFNCSYFCNGILPKGIIFYHLPHNNTAVNFAPSRMAA